MIDNLGIGNLQLWTAGLPARRQLRCYSLAIYKCDMQASGPHVRHETWSLNV